MRNMSFFLTTEQFLNGSKDVTRRFAWWKLKPGDRLQAVKKSQGRKKGEPIEPLGVIEIVSVRQEPLYAITQEDCIREGFPHFTPDQFVAMLMKNYKCDNDKIVNRIEFRRIS